MDQRDVRARTERLLLADDARPVLLQVLYLGLVLVVVGIAAVADPPALLSGLVLGAALAVIVTVLTVAVPWRRFPAGVTLILPVLDIVALGVIRLDEANTGVAAVIVVPALWLGRRFGRRGAAVAAVTTLLAFGVPPLVVLGPDGATLARALLIPVVAGWAALAIAVSLERAAASLADADRGRAELTEAMAVIDHQRRFSAAILDTVDVGLVLLDRKGAYQAFNRRHDDFMRLAFPGGHAGRAGQLGLVYAADGQTLLTSAEMPSRRAAQGEAFDDCRIWVGDDPLTRRALSVSARSVIGEDGEFAGAALAYKDVTDFMRAMRVKDEFVASVSHELRTPLTSIVGYVDLLRDDGALPPQQAGHLDVVARNAERLRRLVADLLHTAQAEDGPLHLVRAPFDLCGVVRDALEAASPDAKTKGIELSARLPEAMVVVIDAQRIAQVIDNLLSNAIKYTRAGGTVEVTVELDGDRVELSVCDTGIGIEAADRGALFTRFFRARHAEEESIQGVGLGLNITKSIVEGHGGRIEVDSEIGKGSTFRVRLPLDGQAGVSWRT